VHPTQYLASTEGLLTHRSKPGGKLLTIKVKKVFGHQMTFKNYAIPATARIQILYFL
jgi:hypothetical protein